MINIIVIYFSIRIFQQFFGILKSANFLKSRENLKNSNIQNKITILIPVFCEEKSLIEALKFWQNSNFSPIFVTTEKENLNSNCKTLEILKAQNDFQVIHSKNIMGFKATQLNFAISEIQTDGYFAIFDIDSRPDFRGIEFVERFAVDEVLQMPTLFTEKYNENSFFGKSTAIFQSRRVLAFEIPTLLNSKFGYLVGHGLFIKSNIFKNHLFCEKTITEDLIFGYKLYLYGIRPKPIPYFDFSTVPQNFFHTIPQTSRWFIGDLLFPKYINIRFKDFFNIFFRYLHILDWLWGSIFIIFALSFGNLFQILILISLILFYIYLHFLTLRIANIKGNIKIYLGILLKMGINSIPPIFGIYTKLLDILNIKKLTFQRTEK